MSTFRKLATQARPWRALITTLVIAIVSCAAGSSALAFDSTTDKINQIAGAYAQDAVSTGKSIGVEVGVFYGTEPQQFISAGDAIAGSQPFTPGAIFQIGSVTKVFTTNLLGQSVSNGSLQLTTPLSSMSFQNVFTSLQTNTALITLGELGDFTGGIPNYAPLCSKSPSTPGCLPSVRPTIAAYGAQEFAEFFENVEPENFDTGAMNVQPPTAYLYSDFSTGLIGLLLGNPPNTALSNDALTGWLGLLENQILTPLGMVSTCLYTPCPIPPSAVAPTIAAGYQPALARASVDSSGAISTITVTSQGKLYPYPSSPQVSIVGGGGSGAQATATTDPDGTVNTTISLMAGGSEYTAPASVTFSGGSPSKTAQAEAIVQNGEVVAINITQAGVGYTSIPTVTITGGNGTGTNATAVAHLDNGEVSYVEVTGGGSGYVPPLAVIIAPGAQSTENIPIWAPAGALSSSMVDMVVFAAAAMLNPKVGALKVPPAVTKGFKIAETPYACQAEDPLLAHCAATRNRSALAWEIIPADAADGVPKIVGKNGGIGGFSTDVLLMPDKNLAVVVFANSRQTLLATGNATLEASDLARNILYALFYNLP